MGRKRQLERDRQRARRKRHNGEPEFIRFFRRAYLPPDPPIPASWAGRGFELPQHTVEVECCFCHEPVRVLADATGLACEHLGPPYHHDGCAGYPYCSCAKPHRGDCLRQVFCTCVVVHTMDAQFGRSVSPDCPIHGQQNQKSFPAGSGAVDE